MKEIPCVMPEDIKDVGFREKCDQAARKIASTRLWVALIFGPLIALGAIFSSAIFFLLLVSEGVVVTLIEGAISSILGSFISQALAGIIASLIFWSAEVVVFSFAAMFLIAFLLIFYYPLKSFFVKDAYVSNKIYLAESPQEIGRVALPFILVSRMYYFFLSHAGQAENYPSVEAAYSKGALICKTPAFTFTYGSDFKIRMKRKPGKKAEYDEWEVEGVEVKIWDSDTHTAFIFRDAIAIVEKGDTEEIVKAIQVVDPDALQKKKR